MKRLIFALFFVMAFVTASWCATPTVTLTAIYTDDNSPVSFDAVEPYREVKFSYSITADTPSASYRFHIQTTSHNVIHAGSLMSTTLPLIYETTETFVSEESGDVKMFIFPTAGGACSSVEHITVLHGEPPYVAVSGVEIYSYLGTQINRLELDLGWNQTLTAKVLPEEATNKNVTWKSSNEGVASVTSTGKVQSQKAGTAIITVTTEDGNYEASCDVIVIGNGSDDEVVNPPNNNQPKAIGADTMYLNPSNVQLYVGSQRNLWLVADNITQSQFDALKWTVSDNTVVSLIENENSKRSTRMWWLHGQKAGQATITATTVNTKGELMSASCTVTVIDAMNSQPETPLDTVTDEPATPETRGQQVGSSSGGGGCNGLLGMVIMLPVMIFKLRR